MKTKIRVLMLLLVVILLGVMLLAYQGEIPMDSAMNAVAIGLFAGVLLVMVYKGQVDVVKKILLSLVIEAEAIYGSGTGKLKYNYVLGKTYSMLPSVIKLFISEAKLDAMLEAAVDQLRVFLGETSGAEEPKVMGFGTE